MSVWIEAISDKTDRIATGINETSAQIGQSVIIVLNATNAPSAQNIHITFVSLTPRTPVDVGAAVEPDGSPYAMSPSSWRWRSI